MNPLKSLFVVLAATAALHAEHPSWSGIYPHLAMFNDESECGTGAVVPWGGHLWAITYAAHQPFGSIDKLYEISPDLTQTIRPESIGGTPANRMIHRESGQLFIGPYAIDMDRQVRVISYDDMPGRPTANARHLTDPANKIYYASMEEGFYEVDVKSLAVKTLYRDNHLDKGERAKQTDAPSAGLPGYHGKGLYSGQGVLVYANNGEKSGAAMKDPFTTSGVLAEWDGKDWKVIRRNQFTEVTGPGGIHGNPNPATDPIWAVGWDARSLLLMVRDRGTWHTFRLPKASHTYDGAHGWNTEWPRIRDIGEDDLLMTMHGTFWRFPKNFSASHPTGIAPRSSYLKVVGDFCRWKDRIVLGCDDATRNVFSNNRKAKDPIAETQSQSNLWFLDPAQLDALGPVIGRGGVWVRDDIAEGSVSDPYLYAGYDERSVYLAHNGDRPAVITIQVDRRGDGNWEKIESLSINPKSARWFDLSAVGDATWIRTRAETDLQGATAWFSYANTDDRSDEADAIFAGLATPTDAKFTGGIIRPRGKDKRNLHFAAQGSSPEGPQDLGYYVLGTDMQLRKTDDPGAHQWLKESNAIRGGLISQDKGSVIFVNDNGQRYRLPFGDPAFDQPGRLGPERLDREVCTERDIFNAHGTFYELPADNAGGFGRIRPITTHNRRITDFCSHRGLLVLSGVAADAPADNKHLIRSDDGKTALWVGGIDDTWKLGKPRGKGGPWHQTAVKPNEWSDPFLMTGYDKKSLSLVHNSAAKATANISIEVDLDGTGTWVPYKTIKLPSGAAMHSQFPETFQAYWIRFSSDIETVATATMLYR